MFYTLVIYFKTFDKVKLGEGEMPGYFGRPMQHPNVFFQELLALNRITNSYVNVVIHFIVDGVSWTSNISFYPSFRMHFNLLTLVVSTTLFMKRAPVFLYRNLSIRCFQLKQNGVATWNV